MSRKTKRDVVDEKFIAEIHVATGHVERYVHRRDGVGGYVVRLGESRFKSYGERAFYLRQLRFEPFGNGAKDVGGTSCRHLHFKAVDAHCIGKVHCSRELKRHFVQADSEAVESYRVGASVFPRDATVGIDREVRD